MTKRDLDLWLRDGLQYGSKRKLILAAPEVLERIATAAGDAWQAATDEETVFGTRIAGWLLGAYGYRLPAISTPNAPADMAFITDADYALRPSDHA